MRVLIVDEASERSRGYLAFCEDLGYEAHLCLVGSEALDIVESRRPHVVMLNLGMTGFDDMDFIDRLQRDEELRPRLFIAVSGDTRYARRQTSRLGKTGSRLSSVGAASR